MEEVYSVWAGRVASKKIFQGEFIYMNKMMVEEKEEEIHRILIKKKKQNEA